MPSSRQPAHLIDDIDWDDLAARLLLAARAVSRKMGLSKLSGAPSSEDLTQEAIAAVLEGKRTLNPNVSTFHNFYWILHSQAHAAAKRLRTTDELASNRYEAYVDGSTGGAATQLSEVESEELHQAVLALVADDEGMTAVVRVWLREGHVAPRDLARELDLPVAEVYGRIRACKRRLENSKMLAP